MTIRFAQLSDIPACIELGRQLHQMTRFSIHAFQPDRIASNLQSLIEVGQNQKRSHCLLLAENSGAQLTGCLLACIERHIFSDQPIASVITFGVLPQNRMGGTALKLLDAFKKWALNRGAFEINAGVNSGLQIGKTDRLMKRLGFEVTGGNYALRL
jgi:hypothetical protein